MVGYQRQRRLRSSMLQGKRRYKTWMSFGDMVCRGSKGVSETFRRRIVAAASAEISPHLNRAGRQSQSLECEIESGTVQPICAEQCGKVYWLPDL
jgi:hypothetical protein